MKIWQRRWWDLHPRMGVLQTLALATSPQRHIFVRDRPYLYFFAMLWPYEI